MTAIAAVDGALLIGPRRWWVVWICALFLTYLLFLARDQVPWLTVYPDDWTVPVRAWAGGIAGFLIDTLQPVTRFLKSVLEVPLSFAFGLLDRGFRLGNDADAARLPPLSWSGISVAMTIVAYRFGGRQLALLAASTCLYLVFFNQWSSAMKTLAVVAIAIPIGVVLGALIGILGYRAPRLNRWVIVPLLDLAQATPTFAYLVPLLMFFGINPVSAMLATLIYAMPPMIRNTTLGLQQVPDDVREFGLMAGCTRRQQLWRILVPSAQASLMLGINQNVNSTMNMVIISSMIGAGGLGFDVLMALRALKVGTALEAGASIVLIAIMFDRLIKAIASRKPVVRISGEPFWRRDPLFAAALAAALGLTALAIAVPELGRLPKTLTVTTAPWWDATIKWLVQALFDDIEAVRTFLVLHVLNRFKSFLLALPWVAVVGLLGLAGYRLGGRALALLAVALTFFCVSSGFWSFTVLTVYLCGVSTAIACVIGMPLGVLAARSILADRILTIIVDTLQTIPLFVFLIPAVMFLRVGDVAAMLGIVLYAVTPAIKYTNHGLRQVAPTLIEAANMAGCTRRQLLWRVQIPLALPEIMLGVNQVLMFAIAMDIIAAMIGTRDLGQEIFTALSKADPGRGIVAGLCTAFIGIVADRLISAWSRRVKERFGLA
ncbi:MAG TPA: ABC transporter permease subunit [Candidatus Acidoferrum sp.]|nr:ABC transporter permease subunit [Candidatus Acidoferrum sp.]